MSLGKYGDEYDNTSADTSEGYVETINRALANGWSKENIGSHIVRNNQISHCEQVGIVGSLGPIFCTITGNTIHDIHVRRLFSGCEMAGIKFHGAVDTVISRNHIYRTDRGIWLDWMSQGTHVTGNLLHDNYRDDLFVEVNHGPFLVDNNIMLSGICLLDNSQGGAYVHNLFTGGLGRVFDYDSRLTPYFKPHSTEIISYHDNPSGDDRFYNNMLIGQASLAGYNSTPLPVFMGGNVFLNGAVPSVHEVDPLVQSQYDPQIVLHEEADGMYLDITVDATWAQKQSHQIITSQLLGKPLIPNFSYAQPNGSLYYLDTDYFGRNRVLANPYPGPFVFECLGYGTQSFKVWPVEDATLLGDLNNDCIVDMEDLVIMLQSWLTE